MYHIFIDVYNLHEKIGAGFFLKPFLSQKTPRIQRRKKRCFLAPKVMGQLSELQIETELLKPWIWRTKKPAFFTKGLAWSGLPWNNEIRDFPY